jgi:hypothetical protein
MTRKQCRAFAAAKLQREGLFVALNPGRSRGTARLVGEFGKELVDAQIKAI